MRWESFVIGETLNVVNLLKPFSPALGQQPLPQKFLPMRWLKSLKPCYLTINLLHNFGVVCFVLVTIVNHP
jgi:hypothetical protein